MDFERSRYTGQDDGSYGAYVGLKLRKQDQKFCEMQKASAASAQEIKRLRKMNQQLERMEKKAREAAQRRARDEKRLHDRQKREQRESQHVLRAERRAPSTKSQVAYAGRASSTGTRSKSSNESDWNYVWGGLGILMLVSAVLAFLQWFHTKVLSGLGMFGVTSPRVATIVMVLDLALPLLILGLWWWRAGDAGREEVTMPLWIAALASTALLWMFSLFALFS